MTTDKMPEFSRPPLLSPRAVVFDTETHDKKAPRLVEAAYGDLDPHTLILDLDSIVVQRFNPGEPIAYGAMATHFILDDEVADCPASDTFRLPPDVRYVVGHNIAFDLEAIGNPEGVVGIDTLALARRAWPQADSYTQSALFLRLQDALGMDMRQARERLRGAHSAAVDIGICGFILQQLGEALAPQCAEVRAELGKEASALDCLHAVGLAAEIPLMMTFGKHEGMPAMEIPASYKRWYMEQTDPDPMVVLAMTGGRTPAEQARYRLAQRLFGEAAVDLESTVRPRLVG